MDKDRLPPDEPVITPRLSLAEEQRRAFEEDRKSGPKQSHLPFPGFLYRN
jgi:hypothetical protein